MHHHLPVACEGGGEIFAASRICAFFSRVRAREVAGDALSSFAPDAPRGEILGVISHGGSWHPFGGREGKLAVTP